MSDMRLAAAEAGRLAGVLRSRIEHASARAAVTGCVGTGEVGPLQQPHTVVEESLHWADGTEMPMRYVMVLGGKWLRAGYSGDPRCTAADAVREGVEHG